MSRHTRIAGKLSRSFGIVDDEDLVVEMRDDGTIAIREEPVNRRLKRNEQLDELVIDVRAAWEARKSQPKVGDIERRIDKVLAKLPVMALSGAPDKVGYQAKVWLMDAMAHEFGTTKDA